MDDKTIFKKMTPTIYEFTKDFAIKKMHPFTSDDIKASWLKQFPESSFYFDGRILQTLAKIGIITLTGRSFKSTFPKAKGRRVHEWISTPYRLSQQAKRKVPQPEIQFDA